MAEDHPVSFQAGRPENAPPHPGSLRQISTGGPDIEGHRAKAQNRFGSPDDGVCEGVGCRHRTRPSWPEAAYLGFWENMLRTKG